MADNERTSRRRSVVIVGGGFAGVACARALAKHDDIHVTLIDKNDYHQFQPLLYQVATSMLAARRHRLPAAQDRRRVRRLRGASPGGRLRRPGGEVRHDGQRRHATRATTSCSRPAPSRTSSRPRAPSTRSRSTRSTTRSACGRGSSRPSRRRIATRAAPTGGALDFVVVGGGPTGVEVAGALSEMINTTMVHEFPSLAPRGQGPPGRSRQGAAQDVRRQGPRRTRPGSSRRTAWTFGWARASPRSARAT